MVKLKTNDHGLALSPSGSMSAINPDDGDRPNICSTMMQLIAQDDSNAFIHHESPICYT
jgi:hypothetical protein